jgi:hypothetical protein
MPKDISITLQITRKRWSGTRCRILRHQAFRTTRKSTLLTNAAPSYSNGLSSTPCSFQAHIANNSQFKIDQIDGSLHCRWFPGHLGLFKSAWRPRSIWIVSRYWMEAIEAVSPPLISHSIPMKISPLQKSASLRARLFNWIRITINKPAENINALVSEMKTGFKVNGILE